MELLISQISGLQIYIIKIAPIVQISIMTVFLWVQKTVLLENTLYTLFESENERQKIEPVPIPLPRASKVNTT